MFMFLAGDTGFAWFSTGSFG